MTHLRLILTWVFTTVIGQLFGQDTTIYDQENASLFGNQYTFIKINNTDMYGTFNQSTVSDDGLSMYGQGTFKETKRKIRLTFDTTQNHSRVVLLANKEHRDTLYIKWFDWWGIDQELFSIRYTDTTKNKNVYSSGESGLLKIPKTELKDKKVSLYKFAGYRKIIDFEVPNEINEINIFANDTITMFPYDKTKEKLTKKKDGFITKGMWTKGGRTLFSKREK